MTHRFAEQRRDIHRHGAARRAGRAAPWEGSVLALQRSAGNAAVAGLVARQPAPPGVALPSRPGTADPHTEIPGWARTSSTEPLPGVPPPGYEDAREAYTEDDRMRLQQSLTDREAANVRNVSAFVSEYAGAFVELWGQHVSAEMAEASDNAGFGFSAKFLKFVLSESLQALAAVAAGPAGLAAGAAFRFFAEKAVGFGADLAGDAIEGVVRAGEVGKEQKRLDGLSVKLGDHLRSLVGGTVGALGGVAPYMSWVTVAPLDDLAKFRLPPLFPEVPPASIRAAVAAAIAGALQEGDQFVFGDDEFVINVAVIPGPGRMVAVDTPPMLRGSRRLAEEMVGHQIAGLRGMPLNVTVLSDGPATDRLVAGPESLPGHRFDEGGMAVPTDPEVRLGELIAAFPFQGATKVTRTADGSVSSLSGGLTEQLYLAKRADPGISLGDLVAEVAGERYERDLAEAEEGIGTSSSEATPEEVALGIFGKLFGPAQDGAQDLITETVEKMTVTEGTAT